MLPVDTIQWDNRPSRDPRIGLHLQCFDLFSSQRRLSSANIDNLAGEMPHGSRSFLGFLLFPLRDNGCPCLLFDLYLAEKSVKRGLQHCYKSADKCDHRLARFTGKTMCWDACPIRAREVERKLPALACL